MLCVMKYPCRMWSFAFAVTKCHFKTNLYVESLRDKSYMCALVKRVCWSTCFEQCIHTSSTNNFWQRDPKDGYRTEISNVSNIEHIRSGLRQLGEEIKLWKEEVIEHIKSDPILIFRPGEVDIVWNFDHPDCLKKWVTTSDSDHGEGFSSCSLSLTEGGKGLFSGIINTQVPKDGRIKRAGYCNLKSVRPRKSFKRDSYYDWHAYTHLVLRVRGDGRSYLLNLSTSGYYDIMWNDIYHFILYTRGGPYWQTARIPFSKFFFGSKGRVQDKQIPVPLQRISHFGISAADKINGPFHLEIDYIGLEFDPFYTEEFAYEMYKIPKYIAAH